jgi:hypothetical protein
MVEAYIVKIENGVVRLYRRDGVFERVICSGATEAKIKEEEVIVSMQGGKTKIYSVRGFFKYNV